MKIEDAAQIKSSEKKLEVCVITKNRGRADVDSRKCSNLGQPDQV